MAYCNWKTEPKKVHWKWQLYFWTVHLFSEIGGSESNMEQFNAKSANGHVS